MAHTPEQIERIRVNKMRAQQLQRITELRGTLRSLFHELRALEKTIFRSNNNESLNGKTFQAIMSNEYLKSKASNYLDMDKYGYLPSSGATTYKISDPDVFRSTLQLQRYYSLQCGDPRGFGPLFDARINLARAQMAMRGCTEGHIGAIEDLERDEFDYVRNQRSGHAEKFHRQQIGICAGGQASRGRR